MASVLQRGFPSTSGPQFLCLNSVNFYYNIDCTTFWSSVILFSVAVSCKMKIWNRLRCRFHIKKTWIECLICVQMWIVILVVLNTFCAIHAIFHLEIFAVLFWVCVAFYKIIQRNSPYCLLMVKAIWGFSVIQIIPWK